ncbi:hypothetical protein HCC30_10785 [Streptomyces sp. HNM0574]|nr:hypothetical protein [Streptomyces sp. HNM0574]
MLTGPVMPGKITAGYWCEWWVSDPSAPAPRRMQACPVGAPSNALRWARAGLGVIASALDEPASSYVFDWLGSDPREAEAGLARGEPFAFSVSCGVARFVWTARPVDFLPLVGGAPLPCGVRGGAPWE